jgi:2',3'-cyclic-nucleotide 2'-phosphodiesterase (5'-nucleotidase family)
MMVNMFNGYTIAILSGDLVSPSALGTILNGKQIISTMNTLGLDFITFGNHEFDFKVATTEYVKNYTKLNNPLVKLLKRTDQTQTKALIDYIQIKYPPC